MTHPEDPLALSDQLLFPVWEQFKQAIGLFAPDYEIVGKPGTPFTSPFEAPNEPDETGHRRYNVTQIPDTISADEFERRLGWTDTILFACIDLDGIRPAYDKLRGEGRTVTVFSMAGGEAQISPERQEALEIITAYVAQRGGNGKDIFATGHDMTCGVVKKETGGTSLAELLHTEPGSPEEDGAMKQLIAYSAGRVKLRRYFSDSNVTLALLRIDRQGGVIIDTDFTGVRPASLSQIRQSHS